MPKASRAGAHSRRISTYRVFISHQYVRSEEYRRLVRMLNRAAQRDRTWRWKNLSVPQDKPIMTASEAQHNEIYMSRMRRRIGRAHVMLFPLRDEWLDGAGSLFNEQA